MTGHKSKQCFMYIGKQSYLSQTKLLQSIPPLYSTSFTSLLPVFPNQRQSLLPTFALALIHHSMYIHKKRGRHYVHMIIMSGLFTTKSGSVSQSSSSSVLVIVLMSTPALHILFKSREDL